MPAFSYFTGLEFEPLTQADIAASRVGRIYQSQTGLRFEILDSDDAGYITVLQLDGQVFRGETFRWHHSSLLSMKCIRF